MNPDRAISLIFAGDVQPVFRPYYDLYPLSFSTNLIDWLPLAVVQRTNSSSEPLGYIDAETNLEERFYRTPTNILITPFPKPSGPYAVGIISRVLTDPSRNNRSGIPTNNSFMVTYWYPATQIAGVLPQTYVDDNPTLFAYLNERNPGLVGHCMSHALPGVPFATNQSSYPVLIYSHGGGFRRQNTDKALELASHGYIVAALDHSWANVSVFPNGEVVRGPNICSVPFSCFQADIDNGVKDLQFAADELARLNSNDPLFAGKVNLAEMGAFGFSVGVVPAAEFCRLDPRCKAAVLFDPGWILEAAVELNQVGLQKPFLSMNSTRVDARPQQPASPPYTMNWLHGSLVLFTNAADNAFWFQIQDSTHQSFQDRGSLISDQSRMADPTETSRAISQTIRACTRSFFDKYLKGEDNHLLDNPAAVYTNIINFRRK